MVYASVLEKQRAREGSVGSNPTLSAIPCSSSGRTTDSDSVNGGSNPSQGSSFIAPSSSGKRADFESVNLGSIPRGASTS